MIGRDVYYFNEPLNLDISCGKVAKRNTRPNSWQLKGVNKIFSLLTFRRCLGAERRLVGADHGLRDLGASGHPLSAFSCSRVSTNALGFQDH